MGSRHLSHKPHGETRSQPRVSHGPFFEMTSRDIIVADGNSMLSHGRREPGAEGGWFRRLHRTGPQTSGRGHRRRRTPSSRPPPTPPQQTPAQPQAGAPSPASPGPVAFRATWPKRGRDSPVCTAPKAGRTNSVRHTQKGSGVWFRKWDLASDESWEQAVHSVSFLARGTNTHH